MKHGIAIRNKQTNQLVNFIECSTGKGSLTILNGVRTNLNHPEYKAEETFIDEREQKVLYRWLLEWPSFEKGYEGKPEKRRGIDVLHFKNGKIINKLTYSKTTIDIDGERLPLTIPGKSCE